MDWADAPFSRLEWLQASTATIYAHRYDHPNDECSGILGGHDLRQQRSQLDNRIHRLMDLLLDGKLQEDRWTTEDTRLRVELDSQICQLAGGDNDLTGTLDFAEGLMSDAAEWWQRVPIEHQQELQSLILSGVIYADGVCRTAKEPLFTGLYSAFDPASVRLVDLTGFEPVTS